jgi:hypothetical protein
MSMARLVITAVTVVGRSKSVVVRDCGISRVGCRNWSNALKPRARPRIDHACVGPMPTRGRSAWRLRTRSCGCASPHETRPRRRRGNDRGAPGHRPGGPGAGDVDDLADLVPARVRHPAAAETADNAARAGRTGGPARAARNPHLPLPARPVVTEVSRGMAVVSLACSGFPAGR